MGEGQGGGDNNLIPAFGLKTAGTSFAGMTNSMELRLSTSSSKLSLQKKGTIKIIKRRIKNPSGGYLWQKRRKPSPA
jgi:hypothetical protein